MQLLAYHPARAAALPTAPGWPHSDTAAGLAHWAQGAWTWLIVDDDGRVAGECGVTGPPGVDGTVEIGYGLAGPSRGRGLGSQAVAALVAELATRPGVRRIEARVDLDNTPSRRVLERAGFGLSELDGTQAVYLRLV